MKKQENVIHNQETKHSGETNLVKSYADRRQDINIFKDLKESMNVMRENIGNLTREV